MPPIERCPTGGYFSRLTTSFASAAVSTCGMTMPSAPLSSARVAIAYSPFGTRAIGATPASSAAAEIWAQASSDMTPCSMSRNSQSKPADRHRLGDLDAARHADADPERQLAGFELLAGGVADGSGHGGLPQVGVVSASWRSQSRKALTLGRSSAPGAVTM